MIDTGSLREQIEDSLGRGDWAAAQALLAELWREEATVASASYLISCFDRFRSGVHFTPCRLAVLRSFTVEPAIPLLRAMSLLHGIELTAEVGDFNGYVREMLDPASRLYRFAPDVAILAVQTRDVAPELWSNYADLSEGEAKAVVRRVVGELQGCMTAFRSNSRAHLVLHGLELPPVPSYGILDTQRGRSQVAAIQEINRELQRLARERMGTYVLDYDALVARHGRGRWYDERKWLTMRMPLSAESLICLTEEWLRFLHPLAGKVSKALVVDLDNTLWGGVVGEDGLDGIQIGPEYPGAFYQSLQRAILDIHRRGVILAICSKNNPADAMDALEKHPGMLLRPHHFSAMRINWNDKAENLREIAAELDIGTDSLAFLDDNPMERARVRTGLPEVAVIDLPNDAAGYATALRGSPLFERLALSAEDQERARYYADQRQRRDLERGVASIEDFYRSLQQELEIASVTPQTLARVAQLTQKTNQFSLTTRRYTEQQISEMAARSDMRVYAARVRDRFGDNGLVGVVILRFVGDVCEIDSLLLSCRVIGRTVETAILARVIRESRLRGVRRVEGQFIPTRKNGPAADFYVAHGFMKVDETERGSLWSLAVDESTVRCPEWIRSTSVGEVAV
ncbi:MAG: HAD-IIIC family phosphatase [Acidobacteria bacterium]|nr:HAD-IIIC family phosphatase [Acidobacteriota bacterium]